MLTARQRQLCKLLCRGYDQRDIGEQLGMATRTVKSHFQHIYAANGIRGGILRVKLAVLFFRHEHGED